MRAVTIGYLLYLRRAKFVIDTGCPSEAFHDVAIYRAGILSVARREGDLIAAQSASQRDRRERVF